MEKTSGIPYGIPHSALISTILGMMVLSFPLGAYVVFYSDVGQSITFQVPASHIALFGAESYGILPPFIELGDLFVVLWTVYVIFFTIALLGPDRNILVSLKERVLGVTHTTNYMIHALSWFAILVLASTVIDLLQGYVGLSITPPDIGNDLVQFYLITASPITEELLYRVVLVGVPLFAIYTHKISAGFIARSLWHPARHLHIDDTKKAMYVVVIVGVVFGMSHVVFDDSWGVAKLAQAIVSGIILGYVYYRYGFVCALLIHWATNYFIYSYGHFVAHVGDWGITEAFEQPFFGTIQIIIAAAGALTIIIMIVQRTNIISRYR
ncbi:MAG: CPBP family intramembrane metalloprotease [Cenarchaeum sp. SB0672_bin_9]|nr:CPBP family intramembrane metalloprotease [Cenarchaeum sp. SB0662_bin_33]MYJ27542.1 CPBP family intramembrane metalloprotease [Cenarchaeum sp. SB0672_bin_9]